MSTRLALCDVRGLLNDLLDKLSGDEGEQWKQAVARTLRKENPWPAASFSRDMAKNGWTLLENVEESRLISATNLELVPFLKDGEGYVVGEEMAKRAVELGANLGQTNAEYLLEHQDEIPEEFRQYILVFPGTKWRYLDGSRYVPYLCWRGERWSLNFRWLWGSFGSDYRLLRSRE